MFGALTLLAGLVIIINPEIIFGILRNKLDKIELHIIAVALRFILGILLIYQSNVSKFPFVIEILGWLAIVAAIFFALMGRKNFICLITWALSLVKPYGRIGGIIAAVFGTFLVYAFI